MDTLRSAIQRARQRAAAAALGKTDGDVSAAARMLGVQRSWLYAIIQRAPSLQRSLRRVRRQKRRTLK